MSGELILGPQDHEAVAQITARAYELLQPMALLSLVSPRTKTPEVVGVSKVCHETSDAVTRAAYELEIVAAREGHRYRRHHLTSFAPLDRPPAEDDLILCLTWGQFSPEAYTARARRVFRAAPRDSRLRGPAGLPGV